MTPAPTIPNALRPAPPAPRDRVAALLARQAGVISRDQALRAGVGAGEVDRLLARRRWRPLHPRVYLAAAGPPGDEARVRAAVLWAAEGAVLVGTAAAWWHGLAERPPPVVGVAVPGRSAARPGVTARHRVLRGRDVVTVRGLAVAVRALAVLDAAVESGSVAVLAGVEPAELHSAARRCAGPTTAGRLLRVTWTPPRPVREWAEVRNRYSEL